jgi:hypothetical protein
LGSRTSQAYAGGRDPSYTPICADIDVVTISSSGALVTDLANERECKLTVGNPDGVFNKD